MNMPGMDHSGSGSGSMMMMRMTFTTALDVPLWFDEWSPTTVGATFGACLGLFFLAILSRFVAAISCSAERAWEQHIAMRRVAQSLSNVSHQSLSTTSISQQQQQQQQDMDKTTNTETAIITDVPPTLSGSAKRYMNDTPSFTPAVDVVRGIVFAFYAFILYLLMLAVMTYSVWYFIAIILGSGIGEMLFGRWSKGSHDDGIHL